MAMKRKLIEDELSRFEAEISNSDVTGNATAASSTSRGLFVPSQVRPIIAANTYQQVQQKLQQKTKAEVNSAASINVPAQAMAAPAFMATFVPTQGAKELHPVVGSGKMAGAVTGATTTSASSNVSNGNATTTPIILSSAPKLYQSRQSVSVGAATVSPSGGTAAVTAAAAAAATAATTAAPAQSMDIIAMQFDVSQKLKKLKAEKTTSNPIAEEAIKAARASSALQTFQGSGGSGGGGSGERKRKDRKSIRVAGGQVWEDPTLTEWPEDDFRIFCGDLGNDVNDELLTRTFNKYPSFQKARVIRDKRTGKSKGFGFVSFREPQDFIKAMKEMDGRYVGSRPIKLRKSTWRQRSLDVVKKKEREKQLLLQQFQTN